MTQSNEGGDPPFDDDAKALLEIFLPDNLVRFSENELLSDRRTLGFARETAHGQTTDLKHLSNYAGIAPLTNALDTYLSRFVFGKYSVRAWRDLYVFPRTSALKRYTRLYMRNAPQTRGVSDTIVNRSPAHLEGWIDRHIVGRLRNKAQAEDKDLIILLGDIGSGKSSFNKYITNVYFEKFQANRIISSRVEYSKFYEYLENNNVFGRGDANEDSIKFLIEKHFQTYVTNCLVRDLLRLCFSSVSESGDGFMVSESSNQIAEIDIELPNGNALDDFNSFLEYEIPDSRLRDSVRNSLPKLFERYRHQQINARVGWFREMLLHKDQIEALTYYMKFAMERQLQPYVILDGFDYIQAADFLNETTHSYVLQVISSWIVKKKSLISISRPTLVFKPLVQLTARFCTMDYFWGMGGFDNAINGVEALEFHVVPPEFRDLYDRMVAGVRDTIGDASERNYPGLGNLFNNLQSSLVHEVGIQSRRFPQLFRENVRFRLNFARNVFVQAAREALDQVSDRDTVSAKDLVRTISQDATNILSPQRSYRLIDIMLFSSGERYVNFVRVDKIERWLVQGYREKNRFLAQQILTDNNKRSGYIGNIFNYHIPYRDPEDVEFFLEKVRILNALGQCGGLTREGIEREFERRGWRVSPYLDISIAILVREAFIRGKIAPGDGQFTIEPYGALVVQHLAPKMVYLENVFFGCLLPGVILRNARDIVRTKGRTEQWVAASIYHMWLLLRLVRTAEDRGQAFVFDLLHPEVLKSVYAILARDAWAGAHGRSLATAALAHIKSFDSE